MSSGFQDHFSDVAGDYARYRPTYPDALFDHLASLCQDRGVVWDCGAGIAAWCYTLMAVDAQVDPIIHQFYYDIVGPYWPLRRGLVENAYRSLEFPLVRMETPEFAMEVEWSLDDLLGYLGTWSAVRNYRKTQGADPRDLISARLAEVWQPAAERKKIRWPLHVLLGRGMLTRKGRGSS